MNQENVRPGSRESGLPYTGHRIQVTGLAGRGRGGTVKVDDGSGEGCPESLAPVCWSEIRHGFIIHHLVAAPHAWSGTEQSGFTDHWAAIHVVAAF
jgi:hypothetical protein